MTNLEKTILATVAYYDIFDYPLTGFELWRYLIRGEDLSEDATETNLSSASSNKSIPTSYNSYEAEAGSPHQIFATAGDMFKALHESEFLRDRISHNFGFYFLSGRNEIVEKRLWRKKLADQKWKKLKRVFKALTLVPFVRGIFLSGSLAMENSKNDSDVDIIVVAKHGRIWTVRTLMTMLTFFLGVRRYGNKTKDRICLNHYITDESLRIPFESLYNAESYVHLINVYVEDEKVFRRFQEENSWLQKYIVNYKVAELRSARAISRSKILSLVSGVFEFMLAGICGNFLEEIFSRIESGRIRRDSLYTKAGGRITIDDTQLEFHPDSHEYFIIPEFNRRMEKLGFSDFANQRDSGLNK
ncbi:MAG: hypothetical protein WC178_03430 [Candidatus Paceibacterota bacterium]